MAMYLGVDAGGTKTECWLGDENEVLARGATGTVKLMNVGAEEATARLQGLVTEVLRQRGVDRGSITRTVVGLAGLSSPAVRAWAEVSLASFVGGDLLLLGDEEIALDAAFGEGPGILVIAGTGSNVVGRCQDGRTTSVGGWGPVVGDEGSGYWIGLQAVRAGLHARDRGESSLLIDAIKDHWKLASLGDLIGHVNSPSRIPFGELTHLVSRCADAGDVVAADVLRQAAEELAGAVRLVAKKLAAMEGSAPAAIHVAFAGSVLGKIERVRSAFVERVHAEVPGSSVRLTAIEPLEGALWKARLR